MRRGVVRVARAGLVKAMSGRTSERRQDTWERRFSAAPHSERQTQRKHDLITGLFTAPGRPPKPHRSPSQSPRVTSSKTRHENSPAPESRTGSTSKAMVSRKRRAKRHQTLGLRVALVVPFENEKVGLG